MQPDQLDELLADIGRTLPRPRVIRAGDAPGAHEIRVTVGRSVRYARIGCTCGAPPAQLPYDAPDADTHATYQVLDHRPPLTGEDTP